MKSFYIALGILVVFMLFFIPISVYVCHQTRTMHEYALDMPEELDTHNYESAQKQIDEIARNWKRNKWVFEISVSYTDLLRVESEIINVASYLKTKDKSMYTASLRRLINALYTMYESESVSPKSII